MTDIRNKQLNTCLTQKINPPCRRLFITDFDGTLLRSDRTLSGKDREAIRALADHDVTRAVATGRSLYSFMNSPGADLPVDYIIFSTGAGVAIHPAGNIVRKINLAPDAVEQAINFFMQSNFDFMVHHPVPDNHRLAYRRTDRYNSDFESRLAGYEKFSNPLVSKAAEGFGQAAQLLAVVPGDETATALSMVRKALPDFSIIHATSPMDGRFTWLELFHPEVSKSQTAAWLASELKISAEETMAIGNDFNDLDLLEWSGSSFVVNNAPDDLKGRFQNVSSNNTCGVAEAIDMWLKS
ncbi:MAG: HAD family phosphatase [Deltaproteobacteria bacterium]|nr:HAD family phosphatase [Deltaproteobacteria bacterium]